LRHEITRFAGIVVGVGWFRAVLSLNWRKGNRLGARWRIAASEVCDAWKI